jgi:hypothetical protein
MPPSKGIFDKLGVGPPVGPDDEVYAQGPTIRVPARQPEPEPKDGTRRGPESLGGSTESQPLE